MGCARSQSSHGSLPSTPVFSTVTTQEIEYAKRHILLLKPEMNDSEVFHTLGLSRFQVDDIFSNGPSSYYRTGYALRTVPRLGITIIRYFNAGTNTLANVEFEGVSWKKQLGSDAFLHVF